MKGVIFVALGELIQSKFGIEEWDNAIENSNLQSEGIYTAGKFYDDSEIVSILTYLSKRLNKNPKKLLYIFGIYLIKFFYLKYPSYFKTARFETFLSEIDRIIHTEILKIYPELAPPRIIFDEKTNIVIYKSKRKLCFLAMGLIKGASTIYNTNIYISHGNKCLNNGDDYCEIIIKKKVKCE